MEDRVRSRLATFGLRRLVAALAFCAKHFVLVAIATDAEVATSVIEPEEFQSGDKSPHSQKKCKKANSDRGWTAVAIDQTCGNPFGLQSDNARFGLAAIAKYAVPMPVAGTALAYLDAKIADYPGITNGRDRGV